MPSLVPRTPLICLVITVLSVSPAAGLQLDLDVDTGWHVEPHQRVDRPRRRVDDVDQPLVRAHLEVLARVLVLVRRADDAVDVLFGRQRHRAGDLSAGTNHRIDDLPRPAVNDLVVIGLEPDADLLSRHVASLSFCANPGRPPGSPAGLRSGRPPGPTVAAAIRWSAAVSGRHARPRYNGPGVPPGPLHIYLRTFVTRPAPTV